MTAHTGKASKPLTLGYVQKLQRERNLKIMRRRIGAKKHGKF